VRLDQQLHELTATTAEAAPDEVFTSVYLDVDGRRHPVRADVATRLSHLGRVARRKAEAIGPDVVRAVEEDLARIEEWVASFDRSSVRGVAVFCNSRAGVLSALALHREVDDEVAVGRRPRLVQLASLVADDTRLLLAIIDRRHADIYRWDMGELRRCAEVLREIPRAVDTNLEIGGFDRHHDDEAKRHVHTAAELVRAELRRWDPHAVVITGPDEMASALVAALGEVSVPVTRAAIRSDADSGDLRQLASSVSAETGRRREVALLDQFTTRTGEGRAVSGLDHTLAALGDRKVETLLAARKFAAQGSRCLVCGRLDRPHIASCLRCGGDTEEVADLLAVMTETALTHGATVRLCDDAAMVPFGSVAALTRF
jgi:hypothetical protein